MNLLLRNRVWELNTNRGSEIHSEGLDVSQEDGTHREQPVSNRQPLRIASLVLSFHRKRETCIWNLISVGGILSTSSTRMMSIRFSSYAERKLYQGERNYKDRSTLLDLLK